LNKKLGTYTKPLRKKITVVPSSYTAGKCGLNPIFSHAIMNSKNHMEYDIFN